MQNLGIANAIVTLAFGLLLGSIALAAIAKRHKLIVVSSDGDFDRIRVAEDLSVEKWWLPSS